MIPIESKKWQLIACEIWVFIPGVFIQKEQKHDYTTDKEAKLL